MGRNADKNRRGINHFKGQYSAKTLDIKRQISDLDKNKSALYATLKFKN